jgi:hypothetical protein
MTPGDTNAAALRFRRIGVTFAVADGAGYPALEGIDCNVDAHEFLAVVGPTGCGKSTLLFVGVGTGAGAVAAIQSGEIDAIANVEPIISKLESNHDVVVLAETRSTAGTTAVFGGPMPAAVLYTKREFIAQYPNTIQALVNAFHKSLSWLKTATPEQIADTVPKGLLAWRQVAVSRGTFCLARHLFARRRCQCERAAARARFPRAVRARDGRGEDRRCEDLGRTVHRQGDILKRRLSGAPAPC